MIQQKITRLATFPVTSNPRGSLRYCLSTTAYPPLLLITAAFYKVLVPFNSVPGKDYPDQESTETQLNLRIPHSQINTAALCPTMK